MNWTTKDLVAETQEPMRRGYWKITAVSFLLIVLSVGLSYSSLINSINELPELIRNIIATEFGDGLIMDTHAIAVLLTLVGSMLILSTLVKIALDVFLENPLEVGADKMFLSALTSDKPILLADLAFAYDADYLNTIKVLFFKELFRDLWMALLFVPGVIKGYEYRMIPYLLSENPYLETKEAFAISKKMMTGYKMKAFLIDLYFIPWHILGLCTLGIAEIFYVEPKRRMVNAAFYLKMKAIYEQQGTNNDNN